MNSAAVKSQSYFLSLPPSEVMRCHPRAQQQQKPHTFATSMLLTFFPIQRNAPLSPSSPVSSHWPSPSPSYYSLSLTSSLALIFRIKNHISLKEENQGFISSSSSSQNTVLFPIQCPSLILFFTSDLPPPFFPTAFCSDASFYPFLPSFASLILLSHSFPFPK